MAEKTEKVGIRRNLTNYGDPEFAAYLRRSCPRSMGYSKDMLSRPIVGIAQSASGFNNCHRYVPELVEAVKRGVLGTGGLPVPSRSSALGGVLPRSPSLRGRTLMAI